MPRTLRKKNQGLIEALNDHKTEAQSAQKKVKEQETCFTAVTAAHESLQLETAKLGSENDDLKQINKGFMLEAFSAPQETGGRMLDEVFSYLLSGMLGITVKVDQSLHSRLARKVSELCSQGKTLAQN